MTFRPYNSLKSTGIELSYTNNSGSTINKGTPVKVKTTGGVDFINVSVEADAFGVAGVASTNATNGTSLGVVKDGRIENITTSFAVGDTVYIAKTGFLTNIKPSVGVDSFVAGDFVVRIGVIAKNEVNQALKDLILDVTLVGQLG